jgi:hypothetical protein
MVSISGFKFLNISILTKYRVVIVKNYQINLLLRGFVIKMVDNMVSTFGAVSQFVETGD